MWDNEESQARKRTLFIRKPINKKDAIRYCLSNFTTKEKTARQFAFMQAQRFWRERAFENQKVELAMSDYQVRKYVAWYHHQAFVMLAMLYVNKQRVLHQENIPLLSVRDVRLQLIIITMLKEQGVHIKKEIQNMKTRHDQRLNDILRYYPDNVLDNNDYF